MNTPKLLIADNSDEIRQSLAAVLADIGIVYTCASGDQALQMLRSFHPDILVMDLMLPQVDGLSLLNRAALEGIHPSVLVTSCYTSPYMMNSLGKLGVEYIMTKPCDPQAVADHVRDLASGLVPEVLTPADLRTASANLLLRLGFSSKLDGFRYLQAALPIFCQDNSQTITKELYTAVGALYQKDGRQVERSIRNAIDIAWRDCDQTLWREFFPTPPGSPVPRPTNGTFISRMASQLAFQLPMYAVG